MRLDVVCGNAGAARDRARRLRKDAAAHRVDARRVAEVAEQRRTQAILVKEQRSLQAQDIRYCSSWSDLLWQLPDQELVRVLVAVDDETREWSRGGSNP